MPWPVQQPMEEDGVLAEVLPPPLPVAAPGPLVVERRASAAGGLRLCPRRFGRSKCSCCEPPLKEIQNGSTQYHWWGGQGPAVGTVGGPAVSTRHAGFRPGPIGATPSKETVPFVDTHCHLEEVLQMVRRHTMVPSLNKEMHEFTAEEMAHWRVLGWVQDPGAPSYGDGAAGGHRAGTWANPIWERFWAELSEMERQAATKLGYEAEVWDRNQWLLPKHVPWSDLEEKVQSALAVLGESASTWDSWSTSTSSGSSIVNCNDLRRWDWLSNKERESAQALGFTEAMWNSEEMADVHQTIRDFFGANFEGCVTQGCDADSIDVALELALVHPKVFVSFGCHPKAAWSYDDALEQRLLSAMKAGGHKSVAWGEFGLDYSHPFYGRLAGNRRTQRAVFARQLRLAIGQGFPLVIHTRSADRDTLRMMRAFVPRHWKVHVHSFRGTLQFMEAIVSEWQYAYIGIPGIVTMRDPDARELARACPLSRLVLETDAPYLPVQSTFFSHPGQIPEIVMKVASLKGIPAVEVFAAVRENARTIYGF